MQLVSDKELRRARPISPAADAGKVDRARSSSAMGGTVRDYMPGLYTGYLAGGENYGELLAAFKNWVYSAITRRAQAVAHLECVVQRRTTTRGQLVSELVDTGHWLEVLLRNPNPEMSWVEIAELALMWCDITGDAYIYCQRDKTNRPANLWVLDSSHVWIESTPDKFVGGYLYYAPQGGVYRFEPGDVIHFRHAAPQINRYRQLYYGYSLIRAAIDAVALDNSQQRFLARYFRNDATPAFSITLREGEYLDATSFAQYRSRIDETFQGENNAGKWILLENGAKLEPIQTNGRQSEILEMSARIQENIATVCGVPLPLLKGDPQARAILEGLRDQFYRDTVEPLADKLYQAITRWAQKTEPGIEATYVSTATSATEFERLERESRLRTGLTSINEERQKMGLDPVEGGDVILVPGAMMPLSLVIAGASERQPITPPPPPDHAGETPDDEPTTAEGKSYIARADIPMLVGDIADLTESEALEYWTRSARRMSIAERMIQRAIVRAMKRLHSLVRETLAKSGAPGIVQKGDPADLNWDAIKRMFGALVEPEIADAIIEAMKQAIADVGIEWPDFVDRMGSTLEEMIRDMAGKVRIRAIDPVAATIKEELGDLFRRLHAEGATEAEIGERIDAKFGEYTSSRGATIARTTATASSTVGQTRAWSESGLKVKRQWITQRDDEVRPAHIRADRQTEDSAGMFHVGGEALTGPGVGGSAGNVINCRCVIRPKITRG